MSDRLKMKIIEPRTFSFVQEAIPALVPMDDVTHPCPHCGYPVRYPLHIARGDLEAMQTLLRAADEWLAKSGTTADLIGEIMALATIAKAKRTDATKDGKT